MTKKDIAKNIVDKIKQEKIALQPKTFDYGNMIYWGLLIFMIILGAVSFSLILLGIIDIRYEWRYYLRSFRFMFVILPYLWIIFFTFFITLGFISFRKTKRGYRRNNLMIAGFILFLVFVLGVIGHGIKLSNYLDEAISERIPLHQIMGPNQEKIWNNPEEGMLGGEIISVDKEVVMLESFLGKEWKVSYSKKTRIGRRVELEKGKIIAIVGKKINADTFEALGIRIFNCGITKEGGQPFHPMLHKHNNFRHQ